MTEPRINTKQAVDLDEAKLRATRREAAKKAAEEAEREAALKRAQAQAVAWDKAMRRAFKGIHRRSDRLRGLA